MGLSGISLERASWGELESVSCLSTGGTSGKYSGLLKREPSGFLEILRNE